MYVVGGYGDDKIFSGSDRDGDIYIWGDNRGYYTEDAPADADSLWQLGSDNDGNDIIDIEENYGSAIDVYGQGGDDKIIGSVQGSDAATERLFGGDGDDKIWLLNPGQYEYGGTDQVNYGFGGRGNDIIYGDNRASFLYGDDGDDIIYSGVNDATTDAYDDIEGGAGDDKIYGQGKSYITAFGDGGDDLIHGTDWWEYGDAIYGDDIGDYYFGDDTIYGFRGDDLVYAGAGDDLIDGGEGDDDIFGEEGEDTIYGGAGNDYIVAGQGWDTVFGGDGCDYIYSQDGGDVIWGGPCVPRSADYDHAVAENGDDENDYSLQVFKIEGTGPDPDNFTVIMDFWRDDAVFYNRLCLYADARQDMPGAGACGPVDNTPGSVADCLTATDVQAGRAPDAAVARTRGAGCKNDSGPLWISIQLQDNEEGISGPTGGGDLPRSVVAKLFQKKGAGAAKKTARRARRASRFAEVNDKYPTETKSDLVECFSLQICTATMA